MRYLLWFQDSLCPFSILHFLALASAFICCEGLAGTDGSVLLSALFFSVKRYFFNEIPRRVSGLTCIGSSSLHYHSNKGKDRCEQSVTNFKCQLSLFNLEEDAVSESYRLSLDLSCSLLRKSCWISSDTQFKTENQWAVGSQLFPVLWKCLSNVFQRCRLPWEAARTRLSRSRQAAFKPLSRQGWSQRIKVLKYHIFLIYKMVYCCDDLCILLWIF